MLEITRRDLIRGSVALAAIEALRAAVKPVRISGVELFDIDIPVTKAEDDAGVNHRFPVAKIATDAGVTGYSFAGAPVQALPQVQRVLMGKDLFHVEQHLKDGLYRWGGVEHAVWDAIGKIAGQPVSKLLGGSRDRVKLYLTCVWKGNPDQSHVSYREQAAMAAKIEKAGFKGMKIRVWRPNPMDDVEACRAIRAAVSKDFRLMFDRTAHAPERVGQKVWDYETGLQVARALEKAGAYWLEEPYARDDYESPAKLAKTVDILITGGEGYTGLEPYRQCLLHQTYDILQPDGNTVGGILNCRKVGILAESFRVPTILHGAMGLRLAGWLQATLANGSEWQELALMTPPLLPEEQWAPGVKVLKSKQVFAIENGDILAPRYPGLGLDVDEEALARYRVKA